MTRAAALDRTLTALADPNRRRVIETLRVQPQTAGDLAGKVGMSPAALSRHLRTLKTAGLVEESHPEYDARVRIYNLRPAPMAELKAWLTHTEDLWARQLAAFQRHVATRARR